MRPRSFSIVAAVLLVVAAAACGGGGGVASLNSDDVLVVGSEHITKTEFDAAMNHAKRNYALHKQKFPAVGTAAYKQQQDVAIGYFVQRAEIAQKAASMGIKVSDADVEKRLKQDKEQQFHGSEKAYRFLSSDPT